MSNPDAANINGSAVQWGGVIALSFALPLLIFPANSLLQIGAGDGDAPPCSLALLLKTKHNEEMDKINKLFKVNLVETHVNTLFTAFGGKLKFWSKHPTKIILGHFHCTCTLEPWAVSDMMLLV